MLKRLKIAVVRANSLGDFIFSLPALETLRQTFPNAEISLLGKKWHKDFFSHRPSPIDRVIVVPKYPGVGENELYQPNKQEIDLFFKSMQKEKFDVAIQLHGGGRNSNPFTKKLGASYTIGLQAYGALPLDQTIPYRYYQNEYTRYLEVVGLLHTTTTSLIPHVTTIWEDKDEVGRVFPTYESPFAIIHPGATDIRRRWSTKNFAKIGDMLAAKGYTVVVTGSGNEGEVVKDVIKTMHFPAVNLFDKLSLSGLTGLLSLASLVVSNDTGPLHLSYALNTPSVGLFWCGNMINGAPPTRDRILPLISWVTHCPICNEDCSSLFPTHPKSTCPHAVSFIDISPLEVQNSIENLLTYAI